MQNPILFSKLEFQSLKHSLAGIKNHHKTKQTLKMLIISGSWLRRQTFQTLLQSYLIQGCVLNSGFCRSMTTKKTSSSKLFRELSRIFISSRTTTVLINLRCCHIKLDG